MQVTMLVEVADRMVMSCTLSGGRQEGYELHPE